MMQQGNEGPCPYHLSFSLSPLQSHRNQAGVRKGRKQENHCFYHVFISVLLENKLLQPEHSMTKATVKVSISLVLTFPLTIFAASYLCLVFTHS